MFLNQSDAQEGKEGGVEAFHLFIPLHPTNDLCSVFTPMGGFSQRKGYEKEKHKKFKHW